MLGKKENEQAIIDASRYIWETKKDAIAKLIPHVDDKRGEIDFITVLGGRRPNLYELFLAHVEEEGWKALSRGEKPDLQKINAIDFISMFANSLDGFRSKQIVEIAKTENHQEAQSFVEMVRSRLGRK